MTIEEIAKQMKAIDAEARDKAGTGISVVALVCTPAGVCVLSHIEPSMPPATEGQVIAMFHRIVNGLNEGDGDEGEGR